MSLLKKGLSSRKSSLRSKSVEYTNKDLPALRRKRTISFKRLAKALEVGQLCASDSSQQDLFLSYYQEIKQTVSNFENAHFSIINLLETNSDRNSSSETEENEDDVIQQNFDDMYFKVLSIYRNLTKREPSQSRDASSSSSSSSNIKLPKIDLPKFSGGIKEWPEYFDMFNALIHNSQTLSETEKFHYLVSSLNGDALLVVKAYPMTHEHYQNAYKALVARYQSKRTLAFTCWRDILNIDFKCNNAREFQKSLDHFEENLIILRKVDLPIEKWDFVLVYHILSKLDKDMRRDFEEKYSDLELPSYDQLKRFLRSKCDAFLRDNHFSESAKVNKNLAPSPKSVTGVQHPKRGTMSHSLVAATDQQQNKTDTKANSYTGKCSYCNEAHSISACQAFLKKSLDDRIATAMDNKWCFNCLKPSHQLNSCQSIFSCRRCQRKHHTLLHRDKPTLESSKTASTLVSGSKSDSTVLLATAIVQVSDASGNMQSFRALFDTGSQSNFITESAVKQLNLNITNTTANVNGLGEAAAPITGDVACSIGTKDRVIFNLDMHVISKICGDQPIAHLNTSGWSHIKSLPLSDPGFDIPGPIHLLLGADVFADSVLGQNIKGGVNQPTAFNSLFGWLLLGKTCLSSTTLLHTLPDIDNELNSLVQRFWELDSLPNASVLTPDESLCEQKYKSDHYRDPSGRYIVQIPFKNDSEPTFEGSREIALRRFHAVERRLSRDPKIRSQYADFMSDYIESGHMTLVSEHEIGKGKYYIPHHCVLRPDSSTTKLRVVFDGSAKDSCLKSLNDMQLIGPKLQPNVLEIILRFRQHNVVFMADVRQMYRQILISPQHRDYQRIFWRASPSEPLKEYRLNTVTYGLASSPYLACRTMQQLAEDEGDNFPLAKQIILSDMYIDDVTCGFQSLGAAQEAKSQTIDLFKRGCLELRKWASNNPHLLSDLPSEHCLTGPVSLDTTETRTLKVLGLKWDPTSDAFFFDIQSSNLPCTKRSILSEIARIFDPVGFLSPITIQAKCLIQKLWILGIGWDQPPPDDIVHTWDTYRAQLLSLASFKIPRHLTCADPISYELIGFCDSSEVAYGAVIYLRVTDIQGRIQVFFVCSKARVVPLKRISLPKLELVAAVLLADLYKLVCDTYLTRIKIDSVYLWSDSTVVLAWLQSHSSRWATFVANRVSHIQDITPIEWWHHCISSDNAADVCSRGQFPDELLNNTQWWAGPHWLSESHDSWPIKLSHLSSEDEVIVTAEMRKSVALPTTKANDVDPALLDDLLKRFSSLQRLVNVVTYIYRFINNSRSPAQANRNAFLNNVERHKALMQIVKHVQATSFSLEIVNLKSNKALSKPFRKLNPFIDSKGVLRVGGRISRSGLAYEHKHPAFLPCDHPLTSLIIDFIHRNYLHPGINTTHFLLLQQFWIIAAKRTIRRNLAKCIKCYRTNPQPLQPFMSDLPSFRLNQVKPFSVVGVDMAGPFRIKLGTHRGAKIDKAYLALFIDLSVKCVHLEVVSTLSTDGFIAALRRFVARRGRCNVIYSDCGSNFIGAKNQLSSLMQEASKSEKIEFKFGPPTGAHFGGVWEIQIRSAKSHLLRVVGDQVLTFEELTTLFTQVESVMNSRPLTPMSTDPNDLSVLTPGHFLTLEPLTAVPDEDLSNFNPNRLNRWQLLQSFHQSFWCRWKREYLNSLTQRAKWIKDSKPLKIGSMVIIKDDNRPPLQWSIARVVDLIVGPDGIARIAFVRLANNHILKRPLVKLCPLPTED